MIHDNTVSQTAKRKFTDEDKTKLLNIKDWKTLEEEVYTYNQREKMEKKINHYIESKEKINKLKDYINNKLKQFNNETTFTNKIINKNNEIDIKEYLFYNYFHKKKNNIDIKVKWFDLFFDEVKDENVYLNLNFSKFIKDIFEFEIDNYTSNPRNDDFYINDNNFFSIYQLITKLSNIKDFNKFNLISFFLTDEQINLIVELLFKNIIFNNEKKHNALSNNDIILYTKYLYRFYLDFHFKINDVNFKSLIKLVKLTKFYDYNIENDYNDIIDSDELEIKEEAEDGKKAEDKKKQEDKKKEEDKKKAEEEAKSEKKNDNDTNKINAESKADEKKDINKKLEEDKSNQNYITKNNEEEKQLKIKNDKMVSKITKIVSYKKLLYIFYYNRNMLNKSDIIFIKDFAMELFKDQDFNDTFTIIFKISDQKVNTEYKFNLYLFFGSIYMLDLFTRDEIDFIQTVIQKDFRLVFKEYNEYKKTSNNEKIFSNFLKHNKYEFINEYYKFPNILPFDFHIKNENILIELDGIYHFILTFTDSSTLINKYHIKDLIKEDLAEKLGYKVIRITNVLNTYKPKTILNPNQENVYNINSIFYFIPYSPKNMNIYLDDDDNNTITKLNFTKEYKNRYNLGNLKIKNEDSENEDSRLTLKKIINEL